MKKLTFSGQSGVLRQLAPPISTHPGKLPIQRFVPPWSGISGENDPRSHIHHIHNCPPHALLRSHIRNLPGVHTDGTFPEFLSVEK